MPAPRWGFQKGCAKGPVKETATGEEATLKPAFTDCMGLSRKAPPNAFAATSQGVRADTTATTKAEEVTADVNVPQGKRKDEDPTGCHTCTSVERSRELMAGNLGNHRHRPGKQRSLIRQRVRTLQRP